MKNVSMIYIKVYMYIGIALILFLVSLKDLMNEFRFYRYIKGGFLDLIFDILRILGEGLLKSISRLPLQCTIELESIMVKIYIHTLHKGSGAVLIELERRRE